MPFTRAMEEARRQRIGASEIGYLLGVSPYGDATKVYDRIVLGIEEEPNEAMWIGNYIEPTIAHIARRKRGMRMRANHLSYLHPTLPIAAHPDYFISPHAGHPRGFGELKASAISKWSDTPPSWLYQIQAQLLCAKHLANPRQGAWLIVLNGSRLTTEWVPADPEAFDRIERAVEDFWLYVQARQRPPTQPFVFGA